tara:strand:+ start:121 stop:381 length:261 start_codon:yes stop_codon:yes gene_type:complete
MTNVIKLIDHKKQTQIESFNYKRKLSRIRDDVENELNEKAIFEKDELAVSLAAGRYAAMNLSLLLGKDEATKFLNDCIQTMEKLKI